MDDFEKELLEMQASSQRRFKSSFENIIAKYSSVPETGRDEVDIMTFKIVEDHGYLENMKKIPIGHYFHSHRDTKRVKRLVKKLVSRREEKSANYFVNASSTTPASGGVKGGSQSKLNRSNPGAGSSGAGGSGVAIAGTKCSKSSPQERIQSGLLEKTPKNVVNLRCSPMNMKIPILESSPRNKKLCRDSLTSFEDLTLNDVVNKNDLPIINDLFTYKTKYCHSNNIIKVNVSPMKKNQREDSLTSNECMTPKITPSYKKAQRIERLFNYSRSSSAPRHRQEFNSFVKKQSFSTPKKASKIDEPFETPAIKKSKLELVRNRTKTPTSNKHKSFDYNHEKSTPSKNITQSSLTSRQQQKRWSSELELVKNRSKTPTSNNYKSFDYSHEKSTPSKNITQSSSTPRQQQKRWSFFTKPTPSLENSQTSFCFLSGEKSKLVLTKNSPTSNKSTSNNENESIYQLSSTPKLQKRWSFVMKQSPITLENNIPMDDLVSLNFFPIP